MARRPPGAFAAIVEVDDAAFDVLCMFDAFGIDDAENRLATVQGALESQLLHPGFGGKMLPEVQPEPPGEPVAFVVASEDHYRCGVVPTIVIENDQPVLSGASVYFEGGVQHRLQLERIIVSEDRARGILEGTLDDSISVSLFEPTFASERQWHGEGADHEVLVYGVCYSFEIGVPPPFEIEPPWDRGSGRMETFSLEGAAMLMPASKEQPWFHEIAGPVVSVSEYDMRVLGQRVWKVRATVARIGDGYDVDVNIDLFVSETVLAEGSLPDPGQMIQARCALCCRLWEANPLRTPS